MSDALDPSLTFVSAPRPPSGGSTPGAAGATQIRTAPASYVGGGASIAGADRPNTREISNIVFDQTNASGATIDRPNAAGVSSMMWVWGQFIDHDMSQTSNGGVGAAPVAIPADDPVFAPGGALPFSRSVFVAGTGSSAANPRQFPNQVTSFLDGSQLYGSSDQKLAALLVPGSAKLKLSDSGTVSFGAAGTPVFGTGPVAGDTRAGENVGLLSMQALFAREHNRIVDELRAADPSLSTAALFQGARARVEAKIQAITFSEFLPVLIGENAINDYTGFKSGVNPGISLEFSTAAYRFGHTLLSSSFARMNENGRPDARGDLALRDAFNTRGVVEQTGVDPLLRGLAATKSQAFDPMIVEDVRSMLFGNGGPGQDLAVLNIQRGRDHGVPTYNGMRAVLGLDPKTSFSQVTSDPAIAARLQAAYGTIDRLDLYVGGLSENAVGGGMVGETFRAILIDQFTRLRDGDRFWSEGRGFSRAELDELWSTRLSDVILRNTGIANLQDDAFYAYTRLFGTAGNDTLTGRADRNLVMGNDGNDRLTGAAGADQLMGGAGADRLEGRGGADHLYGGDGADSLFGEGGPDLLDGGDGDDTFSLRGADGLDDRIDGGAGRDVVRVVTGNGDVTLRGTANMDNVEVFDGGGRGVLGSNAGDVFDFSAFASVVNVAFVRGGNGDDTLIGSARADNLRGDGGADRIEGGAGADFLRGNAGVDTVRGGDGDDVIVVRGAEGATDVMDGGAGRADILRVETGGGDIVLNGTSRIRGVEILEGGGRSLRGTAASDVLDFSAYTAMRDVASILGLNGADTIRGGATRDVIDGGAGADLLSGGGGPDMLTGGSGDDVFLFASGRDIGHDAISDFDRSGDDVIRLAGFSFGSSNPGGLSATARLNAVRAATDFDVAGAIIRFDELGGSGDLRLNGVTSLSFTGTEDFVFA